MKGQFFELFDKAVAGLRGQEVLLGNYVGEVSEFVRFNHGKVRQPGTVEQHSFTLELIDGKRHASQELSLARSADTADQVEQALEGLRERLQFLPEDPHLLYNQEVLSTNVEGQRDFPAGSDLTLEIVQAAGGLDLVGLLAAGEVSHGFANSLGQRNWFSRHTFNFDFSVYVRSDRAVKSGYAGQRWDPQAFLGVVQAARGNLQLLQQPAKTIAAGDYDVYLAPAALDEILRLLSWGGFGLKSQRTRQTPLLRMLTEGVSLDSHVTLIENTEHGAGPAFQSSGFIKPPQVPLIEKGKLVGALTSPRSAQEYGVVPNGASEHESPSALQLSAGDIPTAKAAEHLGTGLFINNLHYLNYSDRPSGRITGMTRFATLWVEGGQPVAAVNVMRFDESLFRVLGDNLVGLTQEQVFRLSNETYGGRSTASVRLPGAFVRGFRLTL
ncbi:MAG: metallopeptidase TldD-related protein [Polyangiaceae bacterium]|nr:metallopeptidase TldD-related protein [Polyangiaceae bacterium]